MRESVSAPGAAVSVLLPASLSAASWRVPLLVAFVVVPPEFVVVDVSLLANVPALALLLVLVDAPAFTLPAALAPAFSARASEAGKITAVMAPIAMAPATALVNTIFELDFMMKSPF